jgi:hypothetical protein
MIREQFIICGECSFLKEIGDNDKGECVAFLNLIGNGNKNGHGVAVHKRNQGCFFPAIIELFENILAELKTLNEITSKGKEL